MMINLEKVLTLFDTLQLSQRDGEGRMIGPLTIRAALCDFLGSYRAQTGVEAFRIYDLGLSITRSNGSIELLDSDVELVGRVLDQMAKTQPAAVVGGLMRELHSIKER